MNKLLSTPYDPLKVLRDVQFYHLVCTPDPHIYKHMKKNSSHLSEFIIYTYATHTLNKIEEAQTKHKTSKIYAW